MTQTGANIVQAFSVDQSLIANISAQHSVDKQIITRQKSVTLPSMQRQITPQSQPEPKTQQVVPQQQHELAATIKIKQTVKQQDKQKDANPIKSVLEKRLVEEQEQEKQVLNKNLVLRQQFLKAATRQVQREKKEQQSLQKILHQELTAEQKDLQRKSQKLFATPTTIATEKMATATANTTDTTTASSTPTNNTIGRARIAVQQQQEQQKNQQEIDKYKVLIVQAISQEWIIPEGVDKDENCKLLINLGPGGVVLSVQVIQMSQNQILDRSAQTAIWKASPLPVPQNKELFDNFRVIQLTVHPQEILSG